MQTKRLKIVFFSNNILVPRYLRLRGEKIARYLGGVDEPRSVPGHQGLWTILITRRKIRTTSSDARVVFNR